MALIGLFFQTKAKIDSLELDASLNEGHEAKAELTKNPVEDGSTVSDNVVLLPLTLSLEAFVSLTPLGLNGLIGSGFTSLAGVAGKAAGDSKLLKSAITTGFASLGGLVGKAVTGGGEGPDSREPADVYDYLVELRDARLPFEVVTSLKLYKNMIVTSVSAPRNIQNKGGLRFTVLLEQVKLVSATTITLSQLPGAAAAQNLGKQAAGQAAGKTADKGTLLFQGFQYLRGG